MHSTLKQITVENGYAQPFISTFYCVSFTCRSAEGVVVLWMSSCLFLKILHRMIKQCLQDGVWEWDVLVTAKCCQGTTHSVSYNRLRSLHHVLCRKHIKRHTVHTTVLWPSDSTASKAVFRRFEILFDIIHCIRKIIICCRNFYGHLP